jgi:hypothetical protein
MFAWVHAWHCIHSDRISFFFFKLEVIYVLIIFVKFELYMNFETNRLDFFIRKN